MEDIGRNTTNIRQIRNQSTSHSAITRADICTESKHSVRAELGPDNQYAKCHRSYRVTSVHFLLLTWGQCQEIFT